MFRTAVAVILLLLTNSLSGQTIRPSEFLSFANKPGDISRQKIYKEFIHYFFIKRNRPADSAILAIIQYNPGGQVTRAERFDVNIPNGSKSEHFYNEADQLIAITTVFPQSRLPDARIDIQYNDKGQETARSVSSINGALIEWKEYDSFNRVVKIYSKNGPARKYLRTQFVYDDPRQGFTQFYYQTSGLEDYREIRKYLSDSLSYEVHIGYKTSPTRLKSSVEVDALKRVINEKRFEELLTDYTEFIFTYNEDGTLYECKVYKKEELVGLVRHYYYSNDD